VDGRRFASIFGLMLVVGGLAGAGAYMMVRTYLQDTAAATQRNDAQTGPTGGGTQTTGGGTQPGPTGATTGATTGGDPGAGCPAFTADAVRNAGRKGELQRVLYVDATRTGTRGAEAWICQDSDGTLYYQGHDKNGALTGATTDVSILLGAGVRGTVARQGVGFVATDPANDGNTQYIVNRETLTVVSPSGGRQEYTVTRYLPT
jgi:hypothetical protein